jgi:hypothetical protein
VLFLLEEQGEQNPLPEVRETSKPNIHVSKNLVKKYFLSFVFVDGLDFSVCGCGKLLVRFIFFDAVICCVWFLVLFLVGCWLCCLLQAVKV